LQIVRSDPCPFCVFGENAELPFNKLAYARWDNFPVAPGHALIISRRHVSSALDLAREEKYAVMDLIDEVCERLRKRYSAEAFNIGWNIGSAAGQTVGHAHLHVIPRHDGDVPDPRGGVRSVIPSKKTY
jgi:diadenosine tetraphosphate (Ap4A) HIT family hydrolase